jgi:Zn-dependent protease
VSFGLPDPATLWPALIAAAIFLLLGFPVHEFSHALVADRLGDRTARFMGRLTLNPLVHFDAMGGTVLVISAVFFSFVVGWAKPTPVNPSNLQGGRRGEAWVALAGPASNLIMATIFAIPIRVLVATQTPVPSVVALVLSNLVWFNVFLFMFNLLPIPPLDGYKVLTGLVDARTAFRLRQLEQYGFVLILFIFVFGARILLPIGNGIYGFLVGQ